MLIGIQHFCMDDSLFLLGLVWLGKLVSIFRKVFFRTRNRCFSQLCSIWGPLHVAERPITKFVILQICSLNLNPNLPFSTCNLKQVTSILYLSRWRWTPIILISSNIGTHYPEACWIGYTVLPVIYFKVREGFVWFLCLYTDKWQL